MKHLTPAQLIARTLDACRVTVPGLAALLGVSRRAVERWRAGARDMPGPARAWCELMIRQVESKPAPSPIPQFDTRKGRRYPDA